MPMKNYENISVFYHKPPTYNPQFEEGKPYKNFLKKLFGLEKENPNDMDFGNKVRNLLNKIK